MKGDTRVIQYLNKVLYSQLTAINQYFLHAKMLKNWGIHGLARHDYKASIAVMKDADTVSERILFLEGLPNFQALGKLRIGENPTEVLRCDLALEEDAATILREATSHAEAAGDYVSRDVFSRLLDESEERIDWTATQLELIDRLGEAKYLLTKLEG